MTKSVFVSLVLAVTAGLGLHARTASALICCSVCDENPNNPACRHGCSPSCVVGDEPLLAVADTVVYDDVAQVCYAATPGEQDCDASTTASN